MGTHLAREQKRICSKRWNYLARLSRAILRSSMPIMSSLQRTTEFIFSASITLTLALNWPRQRFDPFVARVPNLERHIWPSLITCIGPIGITIEQRQSWQSQGARCRTNHEFLF